jgi:hypothetical protein
MRALPSLRPVLAAAVAVAAFAACGGDSSGSGPDAAMALADATPPTPDAGPFAPAPHPGPPQIGSYGGPVMDTPVVVPIFFTGDDAIQAQVEDFLSRLPGTDYWHATTSEYGVGDVTIGTSIVSADAAPTTDDALQAWLATMTDGTHAGWPAADGNTLYAVFLPAGVTLSTPWGNSCSAFGAYHAEVTTSASAGAIYALMPRCQGQGAAIDSLTTATSHELVEAVTDPRPFTDTAYALPDDDHYVWGATPGGELGDMCEYVRSAEQRDVGSFLVQRTWSNASAAAGHDPCVPALDAPFMGATPVLDEDLPLDLGDGAVTTKGVQIATGTSKTIEVDLWSDAPAVDWTVKAYDLASYFSGQPEELQFAWDKDGGNNGDKLMLTITRARDGDGGSEFVISAHTPDTTVSLWWGFVAN